MLVDEKSVVLDVSFTLVVNTGLDAYPESVRFAKTYLANSESGIEKKVVRFLLQKDHYEKQAT